jgi:hypothetical protein
MGRINRLDEDEVLTVRTYKTVPGAQIAWANTYELIVDDESQDVNEVTTRLGNLRNAFVTLERGLLNVSYTLDRIIISSYVADSQPYDPFTFVSETIGLPGQFTSGSNPLVPLQLCVLVKRLTNFGRQGNILYRGIVTRNETTVTPTGTIVSSARITAIENALNTFLNTIRQLGFDLVMARGREQVEIGTLRRVVRLEAKPDMRFKKLNNRYFDRVRNSN